MNGPDVDRLVDELNALPRRPADPEASQLHTCQTTAMVAVHPEEVENLLS